MTHNNNGRKCSVCGAKLSIRASICDPCKNLKSKMNKLWIIRSVKQMEAITILRASSMDHAISQQKSTPSTTVSIGERIKRLARLGRFSR